MHFSKHVNRICEKNKKTDNKRKEEDKQTTREKNKINKQQEKRTR